MEKKNRDTSLKKRIRTGCVRREDVTRRLAELAFGSANDCVRLALEDAPALDKLDLSLLSEIKRNEKGTVEIRLIDRLKALEQLVTKTGLPPFLLGLNWSTTERMSTQQADILMAPYCVGRFLVQGV